MKQMTLAVILLATSAVALSPRDSCKLPRVKGKCKDSLKRYYFHYKKSKCVKFFYSGCGGNANNFRTKQECKKTCYLGSAFWCRLKKHTGPCQAYVLRWYYDGKKCKRFIYGGCQSNGNNFKTKKQCKRACYEGESGDPCTLPKDRGPCKALIRRWYYNGKKCKRFIYGGCGANGNNFETKKECKRVCSKGKSRS